MTLILLPKRDGEDDMEDELCLKRPVLLERDELLLKRPEFLDKERKLASCYRILCRIQRHLQTFSAAARTSGLVSANEKVRIACSEPKYQEM
mmetsp:Transcript_30795/g.55811  ORF Transcript_30795/g.55811 Transcript_30795/m.55811 type:complete len:92 (-) Transcript_30795:780-1055(-)